MKSSRFLTYLGRRALFAVPQVIGILLITFILVRLTPGDPARLIAGPLMSDEGVELLRERMGITGPLPIQFVRYVRNVARGDLGVSWWTGNPVMRDIKQRLPATMELIVLALLVTFLTLPLTIRTAFAGRSLLTRILRKGLFGYGMAAGAFPDFWLALLMVFVFYAVLHWIPPPTGQLDLVLSPPTRITGMYIIDSLLTGNWMTLKSSLLHAILPVFVLSFVYGVGINKIALVTVYQNQRSMFANYAKVCGLSAGVIQNYITRVSLPPIATTTAIIFGFLISGAVLIETVFSWGGMGQYAVQSVLQADFAAIQGVVVVSAVIDLAVYVFVDLLYFWVDPRIERLG